MQYSISGPGGRPAEKETKIDLLEFQLSKSCLIKHYIPNEMREKKKYVPYQESSQWNYK